MSDFGWISDVRGILQQKQNHPKSDTRFLKGVAPGETVVTDGQLRLFPGARIEAVPAGKIDSQPL
jgi:hypothetical protein